MAAHRSEANGSFLDLMIQNAAGNSLDSAVTTEHEMTYLSNPDPSLISASSFYLLGPVSFL